MGYEEPGMQHQEESPSQIAHFEVLGTLGSGAFGTVYRVRDPATGQIVALKWLAALDPKDREQRLRFEREVEIASSLTHPNLVKIHEWGKWRGAPWCTMAVVEGPTLRAVVESRTPDTENWPERVHELGTPLFGALQYLHNMCVLHRDVKPENIFVQGGHTPLLGDFGLALRQTSAQRSRAGTVAGTFAYMAPEVLLSQEPTRRSDMFSLGVVLLQLITGQLPYPAEDAGTILSHLLGAGPLPLDAMLPDAPAPLVSVLGRMVATAPEDRYFTMAEAYYDWVDALRSWLHRPPSLTHLQVEPASYSLLTAAFSGREEVLQALDRTRELALTDGPQGVLLEGPHGQGKSCIITHWSRHQRPDTLLTATFARPDSPPYTGLLDVFQQAITWYPGRKRAAESHPGVDLMLVANLVQQARQSFARTSRGIHESPDSLNRTLEGNCETDILRLHEAMRGLLSAVAVHRGQLVIVLEDVQRADPASLRFLRYLLERWGDAAHPPTPIAVVASFCPTSSVALVGMPRLTRVLLPPLTPGEQETMVRSLLGVGKLPLPAELLPEIEKEARGHPQALQEVLNSQIQSAVLSLRRNLWEWDAQAHISWRRDLENQDGNRDLELLRRSLGTLEERLHDPLAALLSAGRPVLMEDLRVVLATPGEREVWESLRQLKEAGFVHEVRHELELSYRLANRRVEQAVRQFLAPDRIAQLHQAWSCHLERRLQADGDSASAELVMALVSHRQATGELESVADFLLQLAERAAEMHAYTQAVQTYRSILASASGRFTSEQLRALRLRLADLEALAGFYGAALANLDELLQTSLQPQEQLRILRLQARAYFDKGDQSQAVSVWERVLGEEGLKTPGPGLAGTVRAALAWIRAELPGWEEPRLVRHLQEVDVLAEACYGIIKGEYIRSDPRRHNLLLYVTMALRQMATKTGRDDLLANAHGLCIALHTLLFPSASRRKMHSQRAIEHGRRSGNPRILSEILWIAGYCELHAGHLDSAHRLSWEASEVARRAGDIPGLCYANNVIALTALFSGDLAVAEACLLESVPKARAMRHPRLTLGLRNLEIWRQLLLGDLEAATLLTRPHDCEQFVELDSTVLLLVEGMLAFRRGRLVAAQGMLDEAHQEFHRLKSGKLYTVHVGWWLGQVISQHVRDNPTSTGARRGAQKLPQLSRQCQQEAGQGFLQAFALPVRAEASALQGRTHEAMALYDQAITIALKHNLRPQAAWNLEFSAGLARRSGLPDWQDRLQRAADLCLAIGCPGQASRLLSG